MNSAVSVVVLTYKRPDLLANCLTRLARLNTLPAEILVVDCSPQAESRSVVQENETTRVVLSVQGHNRRAEARRAGVEHATQEIIAFINDDGYVRDDWLDGLLTAYSDPTVTGVGGRVLTGRAQDDPVQPIRGGAVSFGQVLPDGRMSADFDQDPGRVIEVEYLSESNMSFRREAFLAADSGRSGLPGTGAADAVDLCLRIRAAGGRLVYSPGALLTQGLGDARVGGHPVGRRYFTFYSRRNHAEVLVRHFGVRDPRWRRFLGTIVRERSLHEIIGGKPLRSLTEVVVGLVGAVIGIVAGIGRRWRSRG